MGGPQVAESPACVPCSTSGMIVLYPSTSLPTHATSVMWMRRSGKARFVAKTSDSSVAIPRNERPFDVDAQSS